MAYSLDALARLAENLLERLRSEEEPSAETLTAARVLGRRIREADLTAGQILHNGPEGGRGGSGAMEAAEARIAALERINFDLERGNAALRRQRDRARAERQAAEQQMDALRAELDRGRERTRTEGTSPERRNPNPIRAGTAREHARRTEWRIRAIQRAKPQASLDAVAASLNEQGWSTPLGLPWTRDSVRHVIERLGSP